jgi:methylated-DNA-[protein]-cysteine S-methyltransferase
MPRHSATICFSSSIGVLGIEAGRTGVTRVLLDAPGVTREVGNGEALELAFQAKNEILSFLAGNLKAFSVSLDFHGTPFQQSVWKQLGAIPYGQTITYGEVAARLGKPRAARAVGAACRANPLPIIVPCHRVVGGNGNLTGFTGGVKLKQDLLTLEKAFSRCVLFGKFRGIQTPLHPVGRCYSSLTDSTVRIARRA